VVGSAKWTGLLFLSAALLAAGVAGPAAAQEQAGRITYDTYTLPNGLTVVFSEDHAVPVVTVNVWYHVGSANERLRRSGFAHLFEHMMFQGSAHVRKSEHLQLVERAGGSMNGSTNEDRTNYFETLPSNRLNLGLWLEADRMRSLAITPANLENQRQTVKEERRLGVDNQPYGRAFEVGPTLPFDSTSCFPYSHSVIGSMADLDSAQVEDVQAFFRQFYAPNNAVLAVVGDFDPAEARALIQQYYGDIPRAEAAAPVQCRMQYGTGSRRLEMTDDKANLPLVALIYKATAESDADAPALELLTSILGRGESSRLNLRLVRQERAAMQSFGFGDLRRSSGLVMLAAINNQGVTAARVEQLLNEEVDKVRNDTMPQAELAKAQNQYRAGVVRQRQTAMGVAEALQSALWFDGSLDAANSDIQRHLAVTTADLRRVAQRYLAPENKLTLIVNPPAQNSGGN
jgi:predicted Zn-dependent peptidase